jgi:hypothetical protein
MNPAQTPHATPVFVVGPPRSGTTLLATILDNHPAVHRVGETHFFQEARIDATASGSGELSPRQLETALTTMYTASARHNRPDSQRWIEAEFGLNDLADRTLAYGGRLQDVYQAFIDLLSERAGGVKFVIDDTPRHLFHLRALRRLLPNAYFVGCIRDPRDFLGSYKYAWRRPHSLNPARMRFTYHPLVTSLLWRGSANLLSQELARPEDPKLILVPYEKLVDDPAKQMGLVMQSLGLEFFPGLLDVQSSNSSFGEPGQGIFAESVGRWHTSLDPEEAWICQAVLGKTMPVFGYVPDELHPNPARVAWKLITTPFALGRAVWVNRRRTGPIGRYLMARIAALQPHPPGQKPAASQGPKTT